MQKTIKVEVLTEWKDVTLRKYLDMTKDMEAYNDDEKAMTALMLHHLVCGSLHRISLTHLSFGQGQSVMPMEI